MGFLLKFSNDWLAAGAGEGMSFVKSNINKQHDLS
jgi:hypothetical protein